jgi:hypothetical protein
MTAHATALFEAPAVHEVDDGQPVSAWEVAATVPVADPRVDTALPRSNAGLVSYQRESRQYGRAEMIRALQAIGAAWQRARPTGPRIGIGDISFRGGGRMPPHVSHQRGLDVDIRLIRADGREAPVRYQDDGYSRALTQQLVDTIRANPVLPVELVLFNDPAVTGVKRWRGHDNHLHVRFRVPGSTPPTPVRTRPAPGAARPVATRPTPAPRPASAPAPGDGPRGPFGTLTLVRPGKPTWQYRFTPEDMLWTARFIVGEAGGRDTPDNRAVIWAMFNRYALFTGRLPAFDRFHTFIRAYSTPLQSVLRSAGAAKRHMHRPEFVRTGGTYAPPHQDVPRGQLERHLRLQRTPWRSLPAEARSLAERALRGEAPNPGIGIASDFANTAVYFKDRHKALPRTYEEWRAFTEGYARERCHRDQRGCTWIGRVVGLDQVRTNAFFIDNRVRDLPASAVQVIRPR